MQQSRTHQECRELLLTCRPAWRAGHGDEAWAALEKAEALAAADPELLVEVLAMRAGLHLLAEQFAEAVTCAQAAIARGEHLIAQTSGAPASGTATSGAPASGADGGATAQAVADARVTLAAMAQGGPYPATATTTQSALIVLDRIARDPDLAGTNTTSRAINNALVIRLDGLREVLDTTEGQVEAWVRVSEARTLIRGCSDPGTVLRQAVDLGMDCAQWERAWSSAQEQIADEPDRNELIAVLAKAALLAWHRGDRELAADLGQRARSLSVAVDHPWVRTYAYLGGVVAAASGAGVLSRALTAYARCTTGEGHASRPHRAWLAGWVALESGHDVDRVEEFLHLTLPGGLRWAGDGAALVLADVRGQDVDPATAQQLVRDPGALPFRARVHLAIARTLRRQGRPTAAAVELGRARSLLAGWPGWLLARVEEECALVEQPVRATPAQRRVLDLLAEGLSNREIADALALSERTVAVHVAALLRSNDLGSRTALLARHLRAAVRSG